MHIYENVIIGNFLYGLGLTIGARHRSHESPLSCVNLLQQTPMDKELGDVLLHNCSSVCLLEFKRAINTDKKEGRKQHSIRMLLSQPTYRHLELTSRRIHWYVESPAIYEQGVALAAPYIDFTRPLTEGLPFSDFIHAIAAELSGPAMDANQTEACRQYLELVRGAQGGVGTANGGLVVRLTSEGMLQYAAVEDLRDLRLTPRRLLERARARDLQRQRELQQELQQERTLSQRQGMSR